MISLTDRKWKDFAVPEVFQSIQRGKRLKNADHIPGDVPYVSSTANNNGVDDYIEASEGTRVFRNCISLANSGSVGTAFYEPFAFVASDHVTSLQCEEANEYIYLFLTAVLEQQGSNFNFNREINDLRIKKMRVMLPVTDEGKPDYQFMEDYIRELMNEKKKQYRGYVKQRIAKLCTVPGEQQVDWQSMINSCEWQPFRIDNIFSILPGKRLVAADSTPGNRPFIGALDNSNGVARFVSDENDSLDKNVLGVNYNGNGMGIGFYHPYECIFSDDVKRFHLKDRNDDPHIMLFMKVAILMQKKKFGYLYKFNADRMAHTSIMLPVTDAGQPDYDFMEEFGRKMMSNKYNQYLAYLTMSDTVS